MIKDIDHLSDEEFEEISQQFNNNFNEYIINYIMPDVIAFYIANRHIRNCLSACSLKQHIYTAKDVFNIKCDIDKLIPHIEQILKIKYNLKIFNQNPLEIDKI